ncbi:Autophagy-related protein 9A [Armadillidium vulgare]|nr:Autophagy-related protein 9A [Armadillidium vulgare]
MNSNTYLTSYQRMEGIDFDEELDPDTLIHVVPKSDKTRWNHIEDLDNFFNRIYEYHQDGGFWCMVAKEVGKILSIIFTIVFSVFLYTDVDYQMLFKNKLPPDYDETKKIKLSDCIRSTQEAREYFDPFLCVCITLSIAFLIYKFVWLYVNIRRFKIMKRFYNEALGVEEHNIENVTWEEVQRRLMEVQVEQRMCIHKESLTELDIYHRILRYENYFIAMVNKNVIPLKLKLPILGEIVFLPRTLRFLLNGILFNFPLVAAFKKWQLKEEYKRTENRHELAESLRKKFFWVGVISLIFSPFVLLMQVLHSVYHYTAFVKTDPSILGIRVWSNYGKVSLRHYNELDHELRARLSRGYRFAGQYMNSFSSPLVANVAAPFSYITGAIAAVTIILALIDEDVLQVEHVFTITTAMIRCHSSFTKFCPE